MLVFFIALSVSNVYTAEENKHFGKKLRKIGHSISHAVHSVVKPVEKTVKHVTKEVKRFIHHSKDSEWANPIRIDSIDVNNQENTQEMPKEQISSYLQKTFEIPVDQVQDFISDLEGVDNLNHRLALFAMDINNNDKRYRSGKAGVYDINAKWNDGQVVLSVNSKIANASIFADTTKKTKTEDFGGLSSHTSTKSVWRPLTSSELDEVYQTLRNELN